MRSKPSGLGRKCSPLRHSPEGSDTAKKAEAASLRAGRDRGPPSRESRLDKKSPGREAGALRIERAADCLVLDRITVGVQETHLAELETADTLLDGLAISDHDPNHVVGL